MANLLSRNKIMNFLCGFITLGSPAARITIFSSGMIILAFVDLESLNLPDFCIWEKIFGYCPADGTIRALNAFFHGMFSKAVRYNINVIFVIPVLIGVVISDITRLVRIHNKKIKKL